MTEKTKSDSAVLVSPHELPLHCPRKQDELWNQHPRVFLDLIPLGYATCPYCSTRYELTETVSLDHHHS